MLNKDYYMALPACDEYRLLAPVYDSESGQVAYEYGTRAPTGEVSITFPITREQAERDLEFVWTRTGEAKGVNGIVVRDINDMVERLGGARQNAFVQCIEQPVQQAKCFGKADPFVYVGVRNSLDFRSALHPIGWLKHAGRRYRWLNRTRIVKALKELGYSSIRTIPMIDHGGGVEQMIYHGRYVSRENSNSFKERIKSLLLGRYSIKRFASAWVIVAGQPSAQLNIEAMAGMIANRAGQDATGMAPMESRSFLYPRKMIHLLGRGRQADTVAVSSRWDFVVKRRRREAGVLDRIREQGLHHVSGSPVSMGAGEFHGLPWFAQTAIGGETLDRRHPALGHLTQLAGELIDRFHRKTHHTVKLEGEAYGQCIGWIFEQATDKYAGYSDIAGAFARLAQQVRERLEGQTVQCSWIHGDYKIENLMLEPAAGRINGIIDWEHARETGLPVFDVLFLLAYTRKLQTGDDLYECFNKVTGFLPYDDSAPDVLKLHYRNFSHDGAVQRVLNALCVLHHVAVRMSYNLENTDTRQRVTGVLNMIEQEVTGIAVNGVEV